MSVVLVGGSYNPPHIGHFHLIEQVLHQFKPDLLLVVPSYISPLKQHVGPENARNRLEVLRETVAEQPGWERVRVEDGEILREGPSYTYDTVIAVKERYPEASESVSLVIGDDLIEGFSRWYRAEELAREVRLIIAHRLYTEERPCPYVHEYLKNDILPLSSTRIRSQVVSGEPCRWLVPSAVYRAIEEGRLRYE